MDITEVLKLVWKCAPTTDGSTETTTETAGIKYRDWEVKPSQLYYCGDLVLVEAHGVTLLSERARFLIPTLVRVHPEFFLLPHDCLNQIETFFRGIADRYIAAAERNYYISSKNFRILKKSDYQFTSNKFLQHCLKLNYHDFMVAASKHRIRNKKDKEFLSGLWYMDD